MTRRSPGFTTIEALAGMSITLLVAAGLSGFFTTQQRTLAALDSFAQSQTVTRAAVDLLARELRMATYDPTNVAFGALSPGPACPGVHRGIIEATPTRIRFRQDLDGNGAIGASNEDVIWELVGGTLRRTDGGGVPVTLATGLEPSGFQLRYFDGSNPPVELVPAGSPAVLTAAQRDCVAKVRVRVRAAVAAPAPDTAPHASLVASEIAIRNRSLANF